MNAMTVSSSGVALGASRARVFARHPAPIRPAAMTSAPVGAIATLSSRSRFAPRAPVGVRALPARKPRLAAPRAALFGGELVERVASPRGRVETEELPKQLRDDVMDAVESLGCSVTVGDVAAAAGCKVSDAERAMTAIAADTAAALEVSSDGDLLYVFDKGFRGAIAQKSVRIRTIEPAVEVAGKVGSYLARVSFGTTLIASIVIVYAAIAALLSNRDDRDDRRGGGGGARFSARACTGRPSTSSGTGTRTTTNAARTSPRWRVRAT